MEENRFGDLGEYAKESAKKEYIYSRMPENIRQIGEIGDGLKVYIEDYVMTYIRKIFNEKQESAIVILLGKNGKEDAQGCEFVYGVISVECDVTEGTKEFTTEKWNTVYREMHENFPGAQMLGWGCGVSMWNSRIDAVVQQIQQKFFSEDDKILFIADLSEREEKMFLWKQGELVAQGGFVIYYEKNPQMQDYMLKDKETHSFEENYEDDVTENMRQVINRNEEKVQKHNKLLSYGIGVAALAIVALGSGVMVNNMTRIDSLQQSVDVMKDYFNDKNSDDSDNVKISTKTSTPAAVSLPESTDGESKKNKKTDTAGSSQRMKNKAQLQQPVRQYEKINESYIVRKGDTLGEIVWRQYHSFDHIKEVMKVNNIKNSDEIYEGDCIKLPDFSD